jgi:putative cardiolipin synthase
VKVSNRKTILYRALLVPILVLVFAGCARLPENSERTTSFAYSEQEETRIGKDWAKAFQNHPGQSAYYLLYDGHDALVARALLASRAEHTIDAQYYLLHKDKVGGLFIDQLLKAADRGVRVRLLVDDMGMEGRDFNISVLNNHANIEVRIFNPFGRNTSRVFQFVTGLGKQTRRAHNKSFTIDNIASILGGRNIGNEYFNADPEFNFYDLDVLVVGPVVREVSGSFDQFWNHELSYPSPLLAEKIPTADQSREILEEFGDYIAEQSNSEYIESLENSEFARHLKDKTGKISWGVGEIVGDDPQKLTTDTADTTYHLSQELAPYLDKVDNELLIISPYFIPGKGGLAYFKKLRERGVNITVLTNSLASTDVSIVHSGYANYRRQLLRMGVTLYELNRNLTKEQQQVVKEGKLYESKSSLHAKAIIIDRSLVFIGSLNLDPRSVKQNTEIGIVIKSSEIADRMAMFFDKFVPSVAFRLELRTDESGFEHIVWHGLEDGENKTLYWEPHTSFWERFSMGFLRLVPAESQL